MKATKNVLNVVKFRTTVEHLAAVDGVKIKHITFSSLGYEKLKSLQVGDKTYGLCARENGDIVGFLGEDKNFPTFFVTGKTPDTKIKAPTQFDSVFEEYGYIGTSNLVALKTIDVSGLDTRNVHNFSLCFDHVGTNNPDGVKIIGLTEWDTRKARAMSWMFSEYNDIAEQTVLDLSSFDVSSTTKFTAMFKNVGRAAKELEIKGIENWKFPQEKECFAYMDSMFYGCGQMAEFSLDLSKWEPNWLWAGVSFERPQSFAAKTFFKIKEPYNGNK